MVWEIENLRRVDISTHELRRGKVALGDLVCLRLCVCFWGSRLFVLGDLVCLLCVCVSVCICACICVCICGCICGCMCVCMCVYVCM